MKRIGYVRRDSRIRIEWVIETWISERCQVRKGNRTAFRNRLVAVRRNDSRRHVIDGYRKLRRITAAVVIMNRDGNCVSAIVRIRMRSADRTARRYSRRAVHVSN